MLFYMRIRAIPQERFTHYGFNHNSKLLKHLIIFFLQTITQYD